MLSVCESSAHLLILYSAQDLHLLCYSSRLVYFLGIELW
uniref:Uncharacterized protein n=1 Tax=Arundo donax TaxID=35708 RepID=A0A0A9AFM6_ARUDO